MKAPIKIPDKTHDTPAMEWRECDDPWRPEPPADDLRERRVWTCCVCGCDTEGEA